MNHDRDYFAEVLTWLEGFALASALCIVTLVALESL